MKRVVVTGTGVISPIGNTTETFWENLKKKTVGIGRIDRFDTEKYKTKLAAQVKDFDPLETMEFKEAKRMELFGQYAVAASAEAIAQSGLALEVEDRTRIGVSVGCGIGSMPIMEKSYEKLEAKGPGRIPPLMIPLMISNMAAGNVAIHFGLKGKCINVVTACATGTHSIGEAVRAIQCGDADVMVAGGTEAAICPLGIGGFGALTALSTSEDPLAASLPFDKRRGGFVMEKERAWSFWNHMSMLRHAEHRSLQRLADMAQRVMRTTLRLHVRMERAQRVPCSLRCRRQD